MKHRFALLLAFSSVLPFGACKVGPDYHLPVLDIPSAWKQHTTDKTQIATRDPSVVWWRDFNDETLNGLIEKALAGNEDLKTAAERINETRGLRESAAGALYPQVGASAGVDRTNPGALTTSSILTTTQGAFDASWEIDLFGGTRRKVEAQDAVTGMAEAAYQNAALSLTAEVAREYITIRQLQAQLAVTQQTADIQRHLYTIAQDHYKGGLVSTLDVAQAETLYKSTAAHLPDLDRQIAASAYRLSVLLGENPGGLQDITRHARPIPAASRLPVLDEPAAILRQRPDVTVAERNLAAATALQGAAISELYPKVSLAALFGIQHGTLPVFDYFSTRKIWDIGASVSLPVLEFGTIRGQINAVDARQAEALHQYRQTVLAALGDVETDLSNLSSETRRHRMLEGAGTSADHAVSVARERYRSGLSDFTSVLQAEQQRFAVQIDLITSEATVAQDVIALHKALGENPAPAKASLQEATPAAVPPSSGDR